MIRELRIVPAKTGSSDAMGTEVWCGDQQLAVRAITLRADAEGGIWIVNIEAYAKFADVNPVGAEDGS